MAQTTTDDQSSIRFLPEGSGRFKTVNLNYVESNIEHTFPVFSSVGETSLLQIYLRDTLAATRSYLIIEVFGFQLLNKQHVVESTQNNEFLPIWFTQEFTPTSSSSTQTPPNEKLRTLTQVYTGTLTLTWVPDPYAGYVNYFAENITYKFWKDIGTFPRNGSDSSHSATIQVTGKSEKDGVSGYVYSSNSSSMELDYTAFRVAAPPNTYFFRSWIGGTAYKTAVVSASISATVGVGWGPLSLGYSLETSVFENRVSVDINENFNGYAPCPDGSVSKASDFVMSSKYSLRNIGDHFVVHFDLRRNNVSNTSSYTPLDLQYWIRGKHTSTGEKTSTYYYNAASSSITA